MSKTRILIVDDSKLVQEVLTAVLKSDDDLDVAGAADNGQQAIEMVETLKPDLVTMDISMPVLDGLKAISNIMASNPVPILVISDIQDSHVAFIALKRGALEVLSKSELQPEKSEELIRKIKLLSKVKVIRHIGGKLLDEALKESNTSKEADHGYDRVVAIASSTGGPRALATILEDLPADFPYPILIAQHIDQGFIEGLVDFTNSVCSLKVKRGEHGESIAPGTVYISPADRHMEINTRGKIVFVERETKDIYHPSCNRLLSSIGKVFKEKGVGIILTGMGDDGAKGITCIKEHGGITLAQDEESSIVYGMPRVAVESGNVDDVLPLNEIGSYLTRLVKNEGRPLKKPVKNIRRIH